MQELLARGHVRLVAKHHLAKKGGLRKAFAISDTDTRRMQ